VAIVDMPKRLSLPPTVNSTHRARIPSGGEALRGISEPSARHSAEVVTNFEATSAANNTS
jgi:hypothetical protein